MQPESTLKTAKTLKEPEIQPKDVRTTSAGVVHTTTKQVNVEEKGRSIKTAATQAQTPGFTRARW